MINAVANKLKELLSELAWVETITGIVKPKRFVKPDGSSCVIPISCNAHPDDCDPSGRYIPVTPTHDKKSIIYFEEIGGLEFVRKDKESGTLVFRGKVRLVAWLNLQLLDIHVDEMGCDCSVAGCWASEVIIMLSELTKYCEIKSGCYDGSCILFSTPRFSGQDVAVFQKYDYGRDVSDCLTYPFDFFYMDIPFEFHLCKDGFTPIEPGEPIECIMY